MELIDNQPLIVNISQELSCIKTEVKKDIISEPFTKDFALRFCWSSNAIEGNTLSLNETISVIEYDEVKSGHTYSEYQEAKNLYHAIEKLMIPFCQKKISEEWIKEANGIIMGTTGEYRTREVYIGSLVEAVFYPPEHQEVPELMKRFSEEMDFGFEEKSLSEIMKKIALQHIKFESIHPFQDGNGRVGRMIMNQQLINYGLLPISIQPTGKYRQAFQRFQKNKDISLMLYVMCKGEQEAIQRIQGLIKKQPEKNQKVTKKIAPKL